MDLDYGMKISILSEEDGGGYFIEVPDLLGCICDGDTLEDAIKNAKEAIETWIETAKSIGREIPEKRYYSSEEKYSGKLTFRMPKALHKELALAAEEQGVSINQMMTYYLSKGVGENAKESASSVEPNQHNHVKITYEANNWDSNISNVLLERQFPLHTIGIRGGVNNG